MTPFVSVILPTYNRPRMLARALRSIADQSWQDYEIIVVNDGGQDMSHIVEKFPKTVYLQHRHNRGLPAARNTALRAAQGRYIAYLDDDDIYYRNHLDILVSILQTPGRRFAYSDCHFWYDEQERKLVMSFDYDRNLLLQRNLTPIICVMHERSLIDECGYFDESLKTHEDYDRWLCMSEVTDFHHHPVVTCAYSKRNHGARQMSGNAQVMLDGLKFVQERYRVRS